MIKSFSFYSLSEIISRLGKISFLFLLAFLQIKSEYGFYNYLLSISSILIILFDGGINTFVTTRTKNKNLKHIFNVFLHAKVTIVVLITTLFLLLRLKYFGNIPNLLFISALILGILWDFCSFLGNTLRSRFDFYGESILKIISTVIPFICILIIVFFRTNISSLDALVSQIIGFLLANIWGIYMTNKNIKISRISPKFQKVIIPLIGSGFLITIAASGGTLLSSIDAIILGSYHQLNFLATFSIANKVAQMAYIPLGIIIGFFMPYLVNQYGGGRKFEPILISRISAAAFFLGIVLSQLYIICVDFFITFFLNSKFQDINQFTNFMSYMIIPNCIHPIFWVIFATKKNNFLLQLPTAITVCIVGLYDYICIESFGVNYIKWSPLIANLFILIFFIVLYRFKYKIMPFTFNMLLYFILGMTFIMSISFLTFNSMYIYLIRVLLLSTSFYGTYYFGSRSLMLFKNKILK